MRFFNTAGPCDAAYHYMLPAAERLPEAPGLVDEGGYFVVHAPRQTGKTTSLKALARELTAAGEYAALHFSCETGSVSKGYEEAQRAVLDSIRSRARDLPVELRPPEPWPEASRPRLVAAGLEAWARACPRRLVLFFDEIDSLRGDSLIVMLRQLRDLYDRRPGAAPWSVILCGLRDVRDYKADSGGDPTRLGSSSPFNIKLESMRLGDFSAAEVTRLYGQHTAETGQRFTDEAVERAYELTCGQPWLTNALAREITKKMRIAPPEPITAAHMDEAKERLILARATHLDSLADRLTEDRVKRIIEPLMAGGLEGGSEYDDDFAYVRDLGLIAATSPTRPANPIYREVIARVLAAGVERRVIYQSSQFMQPDGRLDMDKLVRAFAEFWREHGDILAEGTKYHEVAPQLVLMAFLQRIVNGGGFITREYGVGRKRMDLLVRWPYTDASGTKVWQRDAWELKVWRDKKGDPVDEGLVQLDEYLARLGLDAGILVLFDRRAKAPPWPERIAISVTQTPSGRAVTLLRA